MRPIPSLSNREIRYRVATTPLIMICAVFFHNPNKPTQMNHADQRLSRILPGQLTKIDFQADRNGYKSIDELFSVMARAKWTPPSTIDERTTTQFRPSGSRPRHKLCVGFDLAKLF